MCLMLHFVKEMSRQTRFVLCKRGKTALKVARCNNDFTVFNMLRRLLSSSVDLPTQRTVSCSSSRLSFPQRDESKLLAVDEWTLRMMMSSPSACLSEGDNESRLNVSSVSLLCVCVGTEMYFRTKCFGGETAQRDSSSVWRSWSFSQ